MRFAAGGTGALRMWKPHEKRTLCENIDATSQHISQEVKVGVQMGVPSGQGPWISSSIGGKK